MIILSGVLVVLAIALLVTGIITGNTGHPILGLDGLKLIYISIGVSIISALCLAIGVFLRRKELFGGAESGASAKKSAAGRSAKTTRTAKAKTKARVGAGDDAPVMVSPAATAAEVPAETSVYVVPGRKRYHLETCRQLAGRDKEELTFVEAREEGFTACTACLPDTALAARAAVTEPVAEAAPTESLDPVADDDPALVTRTDLPVTKLDTDTTPDLAGQDLAEKDLAAADLPADDLVEKDLAGTSESEADAGSDVPEIEEPVAESPAAALTEVPESEAAAEESDTGTAQSEEASDAGSAAEERPLARSRSLFEPIEREEPTSAEAEAAPEDDEVEAAPETEAEPEPEDDEVEADPEVVEAEPDVEEEAPATVAEGAAVEAEPEDVKADPASAEDASPDAVPISDEQPADEADDADGASPDLPYVRILSGTKRYHRPDCALIEDIAEDADDLETLAPAEAKERGCTPCLVCQPDKDPADRY